MTTGQRHVVAVSFDIWGTLVGSDPGFKPRRNAMIRRALAPGVSDDDFDTAMRRADREVDDRCVATGLDVGFAGRVERTLERLGLPSSGVAEAAGELMVSQEQIAQAHPPRPLHPDLPAAIAALDRPVVLTSNTGMLPGSLMRKLLSLAGFGGLPGVFSNEVGVAKPAPQIFAAALTELGASDPASVLHIGDNPVADVQGAQAAGFRAALVAPDGVSTLHVVEQWC